MILLNACDHCITQADLCLCPEKASISYKLGLQFSFRDTAEVHFNGDFSKLGDCALCKVSNNAVEIYQCDSHLLTWCLCRQLQNIH